MTQKNKGNVGEDLAAQFLAERGYEIIERNFRLPFGEIDIVAMDCDTVCFVEVKARKSTDHGEPAEFVSWFKQKRLIRAAQAYLKIHHLDDIMCRFDVVTIITDVNPPKIELIENAFELSA